ncbi:MAG: hypothetical protein ACP5PQ_06590 [Thermoproteota archaeon]
MESLKRELLELLDKDREFKYAVAGYLGLSEVLKRLDDLAGEQVRLRQDFNSLRRDFNEMLKEIRTINLRLERVEKTLEKLTLDIEEEARSIVSHRIKQELGLEVGLGPLTLPGLELNIYGASDGFCILGEASVRTGVGLMEELLEKIDELKRSHPDIVKGRVIPVIYTSLPMPELVEKAREKGVWILKATGDIVKPPLQ